jgi:hypothetical protein
MASVSATDLELRPWDEFERDMAPYMTQFDEALREHILIALYTRAAQRCDLENLRTQEKRRIPPLRRERIRGVRMRKHVQNAIRSLESAGANLDLVVTYYIFEAEALLRRALVDLQFLEDLRAACVHPDLRTEIEKTTKIKSLPMEQWNLFPSFGFAKVDHMFIGWMASYLQALRRRNGSPLRSAEVNRIIIATFKAAFGESCTEDRVKTARRRLKELLSKPGQN